MKKNRTILTTQLYEKIIKVPDFFEQGGLEETSPHKMIFGRYSS
jgi:hypothetical protein